MKTTNFKNRLQKLMLFFFVFLMTYILPFRNVYANLQAPYIEYSTIPPYGNWTINLAGKVHNVNIQNYSVVNYILVEGLGWWIKPSFANPLTLIMSDSTWNCDISTSGIDNFATTICSFLIPTGVSPPLLGNGIHEIPDSMFTNYVHLYKLRYRKTINFAGHEWWVKVTEQRGGPGPNYFSDSTSNVWVENGKLHLKITKRGNLWYCAEVVCIDTFGYGQYVFKVESPVGNLDKNVVFGGLFTWDIPAIEAHREIDFAEFSKWGQNTDSNTQFVIQPYTVTGHRHRWILPPWVVNSSHIGIWNHDTVQFKSIHGYNILNPDTVYHSWTYIGADVPHNGKENARMNLWLDSGFAPTDGLEVEVIITDVIFPAVTVGVNQLQNSITPSFKLFQNYPNPFNPVTKFRFNIPNNKNFSSLALMQLKIYDITGKHVASPFESDSVPGFYEIAWNASGFPSGIYFCSLSAGDYFEVIKIVLAK